jgi:hypothetical protein
MRGASAVLKVAASIGLGFLMGSLVSVGIGILTEPRSELFDFTGLAVAALLFALPIAVATLAGKLRPRAVGVGAVLAGATMQVTVNEMQVVATVVTISLGAALFQFGLAEGKAGLRDDRRSAAADSGTEPGTLPRRFTA